MTPAQLATLKADILANNDLNVLPNNTDGAVAIAALYNADASPAFVVWKGSMPVSDVFDQVLWANLTPADPPDGTNAWLCRSLACQGKQFNVQTMLTGRDFINPSKSSIRAGLQDALTQIPSGLGGVNRSGGWTNLQTAMQRNATRFEKLFSTGTGTSQSPATMTLEGPVDYQDVQLARNS